MRFGLCSGMATLRSNNNRLCRISSKSIFSIWSSIPTDFICRYYKGRKKLSKFTQDKSVWRRNTSTCFGILRKSTRPLRSRCTKCSRSHLDLFRMTWLNCLSTKFKIVLNPRKQQLETSISFILSAKMLITNLQPDLRRWMCFGRSRSWRSQDINEPFPSLRVNSCLTWWETKTGRQ